MIKLKRLFSLARSTLGGRNKENSLLGVIKHKLKSILKKSLLFVFICAVVISLPIAGMEAASKYFKESFQGAKDSFTNFLYGISATDRENLLDEGVPFEPYKMKGYKEVEESGIPGEVTTTVKVNDNGNMISEPYTLSLYNTAARFKTPWEFVCALDVLGADSFDEHDLSIVKSAKNELIPTFEWAYEEYSRDITVRTKRWNKVYEDGIVVKDDKDKAKETYITKMYPLPFLKTANTPFKEYNFNYTEDVVTEDTDWSDTVESTVKTYTKKVQDGYEDDTNRPIYGSPYYSMNIKINNNSNYEKIYTSQIKTTNSINIDDIYIWTEGGPYDDDYYIFKERNDEGKQLWIDKYVLNYYSVVDGQYEISFDSTEVKKDIVDYKQKVKYKEIEVKEVQCSQSKRKVVEDQLGYVDEKINVSKIINFLDSNNLSQSDIEYAKELIDKMVGTEELSETLKQIIEGDYIYSPSGGGVNMGGASVYNSYIPLFLQYDDRWGTISYGNGTIASSGCGPTSMAMVLTGLDAKSSDLDKNGDDIIDPSETCAWSLSHGYRTPNQGTSWDFFPSICKAVGFKLRDYSKSQYQTVYEELQRGVPVIASMTPGHFTSAGHFIVLTGLDDNGKVLVNDPNSASRSKLSYDFQSIIVEEAAHFWAIENPNLAQGDSFLATFYTNENNALEGGDGTAFLGAGSLKGQDITTVRYIAVDPNLIKLGSYVYIQFPQDKRFTVAETGQRIDLNGKYRAVDTGGAIKNKHIDVFVGGAGYYSELANLIGKVNVKVTIGGR